MPLLAEVYAHARVKIRKWEVRGRIHNAAEQWILLRGSAPETKIF